MDEKEELQFIKENLKDIVGLHTSPKCQCLESSKEIKKEISCAGSEIDQNVQTINHDHLQNFIQIQMKDCYMNENVINNDTKILSSKQDINSICTENKNALNIISKTFESNLNNAVKTMPILNNSVNECKVEKINIGYDSYLKELIQKLEYQNEVCNDSIEDIDSDVLIIDEVDSSLFDNDVLEQENVKDIPDLKNKLVNDPMQRNVKEKFVDIENESKNDFISGVDILLGILNENTTELKDDSKKKEPVKGYMLPFVSEDKMENKDNADPGWNYLKALDTDEERYKFVRECWKSLVVPDPNVNLTYHGYLRRRQRAKGILKEPGWPNNKAHLMEMSAKRKRTADDDDFVGNPKKKRQCTLNTNFSTNRIDKAMFAVTENYKEDTSKNLHYSKADKLKEKYDEKIKSLLSARHEVLMLHKFYSGLPDQNMSISQQALENEQFDIEQLYERFKKYYKWDGRQFFP